MTESRPVGGHDPPRGRSSLLLSVLALVWESSFLAVSARVHGSDALPLLFWAALGGGLLALAGIVLALSGFARGGEARGRLWAGLGAGLLALLVVSWDLGLLRLL